MLRVESVTARVEVAGGEVLPLEEPARAHRERRQLSLLEGRCKATWNREFELPWREAGPPNHHDDKVDSDQ